MSNCRSCSRRNPLERRTSEEINSALLRTHKGAIEVPTCMMGLTSGSAPPMDAKCSAYSSGRAWVILNGTELADPRPIICAARPPTRSVSPANASCQVPAPIAAPLKASARLSQDSSLIPMRCVSDKGYITDDRFYLSAKSFVRHHRWSGGAPASHFLHLVIVPGHHSGELESSRDQYLQDNECSQRP